MVSLLWWAVPLALFAVVPAAGGTAHDVVLQTATRVDNRIIYDIMLNIIIGAGPRSSTGLGEWRGWGPWGGGGEGGDTIGGGGGGVVAPDPRAYI